MPYLLIFFFCFPSMVLSETAAEPAAVEKNTASHQVPLSESEKQLSKVDELIELGAPGLALHFIDINQPELIADNYPDWLVWEHKRIDLLVRMENWQQVYERINREKNNWQDFQLAINEKNIFTTQLVDACLQIDKPEQALFLLRERLWSGEVDSDDIEKWRRLIIRSYLAMRKVDDAQRAMRRYRLDYGADRLATDQWILLQAQILIDAGFPSQAIQLLKDKQSQELKALLLLAQLQADILSSEQAQKQAKQRLKKSKKNEHAQRLYWYIILRAALLQQDYLVQVEALETLLELKAEKLLSKVFADVNEYVSADSLWLAYQAAGLELANEFKLLRGDDEAWYLKASNLYEPQPLQARALFAALSLNSFNQHHRQVSYENLAALLEKKQQGSRIIYQLFMNSQQITGIEHIPAGIRYGLVDYSLSHADLKTAASLMADLQQPPEGKDDFDWNLRRSRVLVLGGQYNEGAEILVNMLAGRDQLLEQQVDQYLQVVFDLQNVQAHQQALQAFASLEQLPLSKKINRELAFWKAESYQALNNHQQAAWLYLKSAQPIDDEIDPWYHTAIFKAAEAMGKAGLIKDAREQFIKLLRITGNEARKSVIRQRLQQLRLQQSNQFSQVAEE